MNPNGDEITLAMQARDGDTNALAELVERTRSRLFALAYAELRHYEDARDAVAAALYHICLHTSELRQPEKARAWMRSIVRNECRRIRRGSAASEVSLEDIEEPRGDEPPFLRLDIELALSRLPAAQARVLRWFYLDGMPIRSIASLTGRREGTIKYWLHEGRQNLARELEAYRPMTQQMERPEVQEEPRMAMRAMILHDAPRTADIREAARRLRSIGFEVESSTRRQIAALVDSPDGGRERLRSWWTSEDLILIDERIGGRSALEILINAKAAAPDYAMPSAPPYDMPALCLLTSAPPSSAAFACWNLGVDILVDRTRPASWERLFQLAERRLSFRRQIGYRQVWTRFTSKSKAAIIEAQKRAAAGGYRKMLPEHLLLGILAQDGWGNLKISPRAAATMLDELAAVVPALSAGPLAADQVELSDRTMRALEFAGADARERFPGEMGIENLLLGILQESGAAAAILRKACGDQQDWLDQIQRDQFERWRGTPSESPD